MTKSRKRELLALIDTMGKMADLLPKLENPAEQIQDISSACQCLRENLDCENVPECMDLLQMVETRVVETQCIASLPAHIKSLESAFKSEIKTKKEILFLPYKASMWDSLESIYLAAAEDPDCEALVMPIPYYDKKDGKLTEMHWEISYPKGIPLIDYRKYSVEECRPDIIFIHNPYDDRNIVTSVHPDYFSQKLRNLTKCLVYVPYFVGNGINVQEHFCTLPGCIFAHRVIVQTEQEKEIYAREYRKAAREGGSKFLALGSPKLDKAVSAKREDYEIPEEWEKLIANKKIVFYNTSIGTLLENTVENNKPSDKYLQKIRSVFEFFKNQSDAVLLWRPHPLLEGTIKSMRPWLEWEYAKIASEYKNGGYGIYDDSSDLNRAVAMSDVYYGDGSSVARLFEAAGKPVVYQAFGAPAVSGIYDDGNSVWFMDCYNGLYRCDKQSKTTEYMGIIPGKSLEANINIAKNNGKLYFAPYKNNKISVFDITQRSFEQIAFNDDCKLDYKFNKVISFKNFIYFIPLEFPAIMRLNTDTNEMEYFSEWIDAVSKVKIKIQEEAWKSIIFWHYCVVGSEIVLTINGSNSVMFFNMETCSYEIKSIGEKGEQYLTVCHDGQDYYISSVYENYIIKWNRQSNKISKIKFPASFSRKKNKGGNYIIIYLNEYIWLFPYSANNAYKINTNTNEIAELPELTEHFENKDIDWYYNNIFANGNTIYASTLNKGIVEYCTNSGELNFINGCMENADMNFLLSLMNDCDNESNKNDVKSENAGEKIWAHLKKEVLS